MLAAFYFSWYSSGICRPAGVMGPSEEGKEKPCPIRQKKLCAPDYGLRIIRGLCLMQQSEGPPTWWSVITLEWGTPGTQNNLGLIWAKSQTDVNLLGTPPPSISTRRSHTLRLKMVSESCGCKPAFALLRYQMIQHICSQQPAKVRPFWLKSRKRRKEVQQMFDWSSGTACRQFLFLIVPPPAVPMQFVVSAKDVEKNCP